MVSVHPSVQILDLLHDVTPYSIADGARFLAGTAPYYPAGTVFVAVIDPGVGSKRKAIVARSSRGQHFVVPDNGLLTLLPDKIEEVREIQNPKWMIGAGISSTFHGRDIFSPVAAHIARGDSIREVGPSLAPANLVQLQISKPTLDEKGITAEIIGTDGPYGNVITNITREQFVGLGFTFGDSVPVTLSGQTLDVPFAKTFSDVALGKPLLYIDSRGRVALAINQGNFAKTYNVAPPVAIAIPTKR
jgi:S-adenosylmethionine hydrolase